MSTMARTLERVRVRTPTVKSFLERARSNPRYVQYDLLPFFGSWRSRDILAGLMRVALPRSPDLRPSPAVRAHFAQLCERGYTEPMPLLDADGARRLTAHFEQQPVCDPWRPHLGTFRWDSPPSPETNMGVYDIAQIVAAPGVLALFNSPMVLDLAELYLGCKPTLDNIGGWWSYTERAQAKGTQRFHRDWDNVKGFKLFVYLTDVDDGAGPHGFIPGSHRSDLLMETRAIPDEHVFATFGRDAEHLFLGPAGTCFTVDTFGIHRGILPQRRPRLLLAAQYNLTPSPHGPRRPIVSGDGTLDRYVNRIYVAGTPS
jgi:hypothetical protein